MELKNGKWEIVQGTKLDHSLQHDPNTFDGSVRTLPPTITPTAFWGMVTPNSGEAAADW